MSSNTEKAIKSLTACFNALHFQHKKNAQYSINQAKFRTLKKFCKKQPKNPLRDFVEEITLAGGKYSHLNGTQIVGDAYAALREDREING